MHVYLDLEVYWVFWHSDFIIAFNEYVIADSDAVMTGGCVWCIGDNSRFQHPDSIKSHFTCTFKQN